MSPDAEYPTEEELEKIEKWQVLGNAGFRELLEYARSLWCWNDYVKADGNRYTFVTGGWSGNEDIIHALKNNLIFWAFCWIKSVRGGLYEFEVPSHVPLASLWGVHITEVSVLYSSLSDSGVDLKMRIQSAGDPSLSLLERELTKVLLNGKPVDLIISGAED